MRNRNLAFILKITLIIILVVIIFSYAYNRSGNYLDGPQISINHPTNGQTLAEQTLTISGNTKNINDIMLNDRKIYINENGEFTEKILLHEGYNQISLWAKDRFDKKTEKNLIVVYKR